DGRPHTPPHGEPDLERHVLPDVLDAGQAVPDGDGADGDDANVLARAVEEGADEALPLEPAGLRERVPAAVLGHGCRASPRGVTCRPSCRRRSGAYGRARGGGPAP